MLFKKKKKKENRESATFSDIRGRIEEYIQKKSPFPGVRFISRSNKIYDPGNDVVISIKRDRGDVLDELQFNISFKILNIGSLHLLKKFDVRSSKFKALCPESIIEEEFEPGFTEAHTGDLDFDSQFSTRSSNDHLLPLVNCSIRNNILTLLDSIPGCSRFEMTESDFIFHAPMESLSREETLETVLGLLLSICRELTEKDEPQKRLIKSFEMETIPGIRKNIISTLAVRFPRDAFINDFLENALKDNEPGIQIEAAGHLEEKGMEHLASMIQFPFNLSDRIIISIITILRDNSYPISAVILQNLYIQSTNSTIKLEILDTIRVLNIPEIPEFLIEQLKEKDLSIRFQLIETLGECGSVDDIDKLLRVSKKTLNPLVKNAVKKAIFQIKSRSGSGEKGWLSGNEPSEKEGGLSLADDMVEGALSIDE
ncbi:MAG: HEAT repeat domain-containing protein [bacterium]|nr:HEAT repeat domain-containing protein [bacterium]